MNWLGLRGLLARLWSFNKFANAFRVRLSAFN